MNIIEAIKSGKPFRRPKWVDGFNFDYQWVIAGDEDCALMWITGDTFGDITLEDVLAEDYILDVDIE